MRLEEANAWEILIAGDRAGRQFSGLTWNVEGERRAAALESILATINEALEQRGDASVTELFEAVRLSEDVKADHLQLRSNALPALGGAELRFDVPPASLDDIEFVDDVLFAARCLDGCRSTASQSVAEFHRIAQAAVARNEFPDMPIRIVTIGVRASPTLLACFDGVIELEMLGHGLTPVIVRVDGYGLRDLERRLDALLVAHSRRAKLRQSLQASNQRGLIEDPARRVLDLAEMNVGVTMKLLEKQNWLKFQYHLYTGSVTATLYWHEGALRAEFINYGNGVRLIDGRVNAWRTIPAKVIASRPGKRLGMLLKDPHLSPELMVVTAIRAPGETELTVALPATPFSIHPADKDRIQATFDELSPSSA